MSRILKFIGKPMLAAVLCLLLVCLSVLPAFAVPERAPVQVGIVSDIHYFSDRNTGNWCDAFMRFAESNAYQRYEGPGLLDSALAALAAHAEENGMRYVLIPGDMTANGEYNNHAELAEKLEAFEQETGISVIVTNGNHDINNYNGFTFENGKREPSRITTPEDFREIYRNLGFDLAYHTYTPKTGKAGMLSYSVQLDGGYRLIVLDVNKYSADVTNSGKDKHQTDGQITDDLFDWALSEIEDAKRCGETPIGMEHHGIVEHFRIQPSVFQAFLIDDWQERAEALADAGLHFMVTGHMHDTSITDWVSDNGNVLYDVSTTSLTGFPNTFREIRFDNTGSDLTADIRTYDVDCVKPVTVRGTTYEQPYSLTYSFAKSFSKDGLSDLALRYLSGPLDLFFDTMETEGTVLGALKTAFGLDVEALISRYVNVRLGKIDIFTSTNVMSFLNDLDAQLRAEIFTSRENVEALVSTLLQKLLDFQVSDLPCTRFIDQFGFGDPNRPGTFEEAAYSAVAILYSANQSIDDDPFMQDVLDFFRNRGGAEAFVEKLYDVVSHDLLQDTILGKLEFNIDTLFPAGTLGHVGAAMLDNFLTLVLRGDKSYTNVINSFLGLGLIPDYNSIDTMAAYFLGAYLTDNAFDAMGETIADMIGDLVTDHGDGEDLNRVIIADQRDVPATRDNWRLPSIVTMTVGDNAETDRLLSWYTKFSVTGSDIEIVPYSASPRFTGTPTRRGVTSSAERLDRYYPAVDLGFIGFMDTKVPLTRHTVQITGLERGKSYCFRVGDAAKGWWSDAGVIRATDGDELTFLHVADAQSFNATQYARFANVLRTATQAYPQTDLILSSGNQVYLGSNVKQWKAFADTASDTLLQTPFMSAAGVAEADGGVLAQNFVFPNVPQQDTDSGVYYDFDQNGVHFMVLNTNDATEKNGLSDQQLQWLQTSAKNSNATWKIVLLHKAVYGSGAHSSDKDVSALRRQFRTLFPALGIDMVFEGQDNIYVRTGALVGGLPLKTGLEIVSYGGRDYEKQLVDYGTYYVLSGAAGAVPAGILEKASAALRGAVRQQTLLPVFSAIQIDGESLYFDAYTVDENGVAGRIDSFALQKSARNCIFAQETAQPEPMRFDTTDAGSAAQVVAMAEYFDMDLIPDGEVEDPYAPAGSQTDEPFNPYDERPDDPTPSGGQSGANTPSASNGGAGGNSGSLSNSSGSTAQPNTASGTVSPNASGANGWSSNGTFGGSSESGAGSYGGSAYTPGGSGSENAAGSFGGVWTSGGSASGGIPLLGGGAPVTAMCVLFGAAMVALHTSSKKKDD